MLRSRPYKQIFKQNFYNLEELSKKNSRFEEILKENRKRRRAQKSVLFTHIVLEELLAIENQVTFQLGRILFKKNFQFAGFFQKFFNFILSFNFSFSFSKFLSNNFLPLRRADRCKYLSNVLFFPQFFSVSFFFDEKL